MIKILPLEKWTSNMKGNLLSEKQRKTIFKNGLLCVVNIKGHKDIK